MLAPSWVPRLSKVITPRFPHQPHSLVKCAAVLPPHTHPCTPSGQRILQTGRWRNGTINPAEVWSRSAESF